MTADVTVDLLSATQVWSETTMTKATVASHDTRFKRFLSVAFEYCVHQHVNGLDLVKEYFIEPLGFLILLAKVVYRGGV